MQERCQHRAPDLAQTDGGGWRRLKLMAPSPQGEALFSGGPGAAAAGRSPKVLTHESAEMGILIYVSDWCGRGL